MPPVRATAFAPAKVNLTLHVTGRRDDGYHLLDSLVAHVGTGDDVTVADADAPAFTVTGPHAAGVPTDGTNLVLRAAALMGGPPLSITLHKRLPPASGIGGGSSDAAATLRAIAALRGVPLPPDAAVLALGADVPVCLAARPARMSGIGERLAPVAPLPPAWLVLANPGVSVPTPDVFRALARRDNPPMPRDLPAWPDAAALAAWLATQRNDLEAPARAIAPAIGNTLAALAATPGCLLARMSGSGATCFGLFSGATTAQAAAATLAAGHPDWWTAAAPLLTRPPEPRLTA